MHVRGGSELEILPARYGTRSRLALMILLRVLLLKFILHTLYLLSELAVVVNCISSKDVAQCIRSMAAPTPPLLLLLFLRKIC